MGQRCPEKRRAEGKGYQNYTVRKNAHGPSSRGLSLRGAETLFFRSGGHCLLGHYLQESSALHGGQSDIGDLLGCASQLPSPAHLAALVRSCTESVHGTVLRRLVSAESLPPGHRTADLFSSGRARRRPPTSASRKATDGLPNHQTPFVPHLCAMDLQNHSNTMKYSS